MLVTGGTFPTGSRAAGMLRWPPRPPPPTPVLSTRRHVTEFKTLYSPGSQIFSGGCRALSRSFASVLPFPGSLTVCETGPEPRGDGRCSLPGSPQSSLPPPVGVGSRVTRSEGAQSSSRAPGSGDTQYR